MLSPEELLKPRYKVIADYPNSVHKIGSIIPPGEQIDLPTYYGCSKYPHLFKKLEWWEFRTEEEMPEYVRGEYSDANEVIKVKKHFSRVQHNYVGVSENHFAMYNGSERYEHFLPATETEYNEYKLNKP